MNKERLKKARKAWDAGIKNLNSTIEARESVIKAAKRFVNSDYQGKYLLLLKVTVKRLEKCEKRAKQLP